MNAILTTNEMDEILRAAQATLANAKECEWMNRFSQLSKLSKDELKTLLSKLDAQNLTFYCGAVNAGFLLGFSSMESSSYPLDNVWNQLVNHFKMVGPEQSTDDIAMTFGKLRQFLLDAQLIKPLE